MVAELDAITAAAAPVTLHNASLNKLALHGAIMHPHLKAQQ